MKKILVKKVGGELEPGEFDGLEDMQKIVGGHIECVQLPHDIDLWLNEEGKLEGLPANIALFHNGEVVDIIVGDVFFASHDDEGDSTSLNDIQKKWIEQRLNIVGSHEGKLVYGLFVE